MRRAPVLLGPFHPQPAQGPRTRDHHLGETVLSDQEALALQKRLFRLWHRYRGDPFARGAPITRAQLIAKTFPIEKKFFALARRYVNAANHDVGNLARALFVDHPHFFTFVHEEGVEADEQRPRTRTPDGRPVALIPSSG